MTDEQILEMLKHVPDVEVRAFALLTIAFDSLDCDQSLRVFTWLQRKLASKFYQYQVDEGMRLVKHSQEILQAAHEKYAEIRALVDGSLAMLKEAEAQHQAAITDQP